MSDAARLESVERLKLSYLERASFADLERVSVAAASDDGSFWGWIPHSLPNDPP